MVKKIYMRAEISLPHLPPRIFTFAQSHPALKTWRSKKVARWALQLKKKEMGKTYSLKYILNHNMFLTFISQFLIFKRHYYKVSLSHHWQSNRCFFMCVFRRSARQDAKSQWLHLFGLSPMWLFKWTLKLPIQKDAKLHLLHLYDFSPLCVFKCLLKALGSEHAYYAYYALHSHIDCICLVFHHCVL